MRDCGERGPGELEEENNYEWERNSRSNGALFAFMDDPLIHPKVSFYPWSGRTGSIESILMLEKFYKIMDVR